MIRRVALTVWVTSTLVGLMFMLILRNEKL